MFCSKCGKEVSSRDDFCPSCGNQLNFNVEYEVVEEKKPGKVWSVFANVGFGLGIGSLCSSIIGIGYIFGIIGIVLSALGLKSVDCHRKAKTGLILSIIATVIGFILTCVLVAVYYDTIMIFINQLISQYETTI